MGLQLDRSAGQEGPAAVPEIFHGGVVHDQLVVQPDAGPRPHLPDSQLIPLAERLVGQHQRIFAGRPPAVVPQPPGPLVGAELPLPARLGEIPNLHLRGRSQIDATVGQGHGLVLQPQLDIAVIGVGGQVGTLAVVDQFAIFYSPVLLSLGPVRGPLLPPRRVRHRRQLAGIDVPLAVPAAEVLPVEQSLEACRWGGRTVGVGGPADAAQHQDDCPKSDLENTHTGSSLLTPSPIAATRCRGMGFLTCRPQGDLRPPPKHPDFEQQQTKVNRGDDRMVAEVVRLQ